MKRRTIIAAIVASALMTGCTLEQEVAMNPRADGMPLDAIAYKAPTFADGLYSYRVRDRQSGAEWWLVWMNDGDPWTSGRGAWVVLPIGGSNE